MTYYPFGMNHQTGSAYFAKGIYKSYKYNCKELQETGLYSYGWREYMPDIGRWNGIDQLSESYLSTSTYAYVANNPVSNFDVDGRWFDQDGHIVDTSGQTFGFLGASFKPKYATNFLGVNPGDGGGGGGGNGYTFTGNDASSMFSYFANGVTMSGISFNKGFAMWSTLDDSSNSMYNDNDGMLTGLTGGVTLHRAKINDTSWNTDWYGPGGKINWFIGAVGAGVDNFARRFYIGTARPNAPVRFLGQNFYGNGINQFLNFNL